METVELNGRHHILVSLLHEQEELQKLMESEALQLKRLEAWSNASEQLCLDTPTHSFVTPINDMMALVKDEIEDRSTRLHQYRDLLSATQMMIEIERSLDPKAGGVDNYKCAETATGKGL